MRLLPLVKIVNGSSAVSKMPAQSCGYARFPPYLPQPALLLNFICKVQIISTYTKHHLLHLRIFQMEDLVEIMIEDSGCG